MKRSVLFLLCVISMTGCGFFEMEPIAPSGQNLSVNGTANSYIVTEPGKYSFRSDIGNTVIPVGEVHSAEVLWESFGTSTSPALGQLVSNLSVTDHWICFTVPSPLHFGNALIAAKDKSGKILWSWHIWITGPVSELTYANGAGVVMDRNLGAVSVMLGSPGCIGLMYQWGRKDPFLASCFNDRNLTAANNGIDKDVVPSNSLTGTFDYAHTHPTTFIASSSDWMAEKDPYAWSSEKTLYDPCPPGWKVWSGDRDGVWAKAGFPRNCEFQLEDRGIRIPETVCGDECWFPANGYMTPDGGKLVETGNAGTFWSRTPVPGSLKAYGMVFDSDGLVSSIVEENKAAGMAVRCVKE